MVPLRETLLVLLVEILLELANGGGRQSKLAAAVVIEQRPAVGCGDTHQAPFEHAVEVAAPGFVVDVEGAYLRRRGIIGLRPRWQGDAPGRSRRYSDDAGKAQGTADGNEQLRPPESVLKVSGKKRHRSCFLRAQYLGARSTVVWDVYSANSARLSTGR
jgi:hypothetical protein